MDAQIPSGGGSQALHRWTERARSVPEVEAALARIWTAAAAESTGGVAPGKGGREVVVRTRARVLTLVVVAQRPETAERAAVAVADVAGRHPSRSVVLALGDPDGPASFDARVDAQWPEGSATSALCIEQILIRLGGESCEHLAGVAAPLLIHDLPVVAWWTDDPALGTRPFREIVAMTDRLVVDSGLFRDDGRLRLIGLAAETARGTVVSDIGWMRLALWRELLAGLVEPPALVACLPSAHRLRIVVGRPGELVRISKAVLLAGWLASRLGWRVEKPLAQHRGRTGLTATFTRRGGRVELAIEGRDPGSDPTLRTPGSLLEVELELLRGGHRLSCRVARQADHLLALATRDGEEVGRGAGRLERFGDALYLAEALEAVGRDALYQEALRVAAQLLGG